VSSFIVIASFFKMAVSLASLSAVAKMVPPLFTHLFNLIFAAVFSFFVFSKRKSLILEKLKQPVWHYKKWAARLVIGLSLGIVLLTLFYVESSWITICFTLLFFAFCIYLVLSRQKLEKTIKERTAELSDEKQKVEGLLLNILPAYVLEELKEKGKSDPRYFEDVAILFTDFVGFTKISSQIEPIKLIEELNDMFTRFDDIVESHRCERIKTIGDSYMAVAGLSGKEENPAHQMAQCAIEILKFIEQRNKISAIEWKIRIGISAGQSMGGIVGKTKYLFDLFGDTINTASRMESNSEPMKINVSEAAFKKLNSIYTFSERPEVDVKGKGKMKMYFINHQFL
jgi:class 3 adenylate cyclase